MARACQRVRENPYGSPGACHLGELSRVPAVGGMLGHSLLGEKPCFSLYPWKVGLFGLLRQCGAHLCVPLCCIYRVCHKAAGSEWDPEQSSALERFRLGRKLPDQLSLKTQQTQWYRKCLWQVKMLSGASDFLQ